jgi:hypothetical protein
MITYAWTDPHTDQSRETGFLVPGAAWDSIRNEIVFVIHFDPLDHNFLLLDHTVVPRRSRCHIRACSDDERDQTACPEPPGPPHVVNKPNICPFYVQCPTYCRFMKLHKKATSLRNRKQDWIPYQLEANNCFKSNCMMSDDGFQHLNLNQVSGAAIVAPDPAQVYNFTETGETIAASATSSRTADTSSRTKTKGRISRDYLFLCVCRCLTNHRADFDKPPCIRFTLTVQTFSLFTTNSYNSHRRQCVVQKLLPSFTPRVCGTCRGCLQRLRSRSKEAGSVRVRRTCGHSIPRETQLTQKGIRHASGQE